MDKRFKDTVYAVHANSFEVMMLWKEFNEYVSWEEDSNGVLINVGDFNGSPVNVDFFWSIVNGKRVVFYSCTSDVMVYSMVEQWIRDNLKVPICDAMNFHLFLRDIGVLPLAKSVKWIPELKEHR